MLNIVPFGEAVLEKKILYELFKELFPLIIKLINCYTFINEQGSKAIHF